ncbi:hypothetical protein [Nocardioides sp. CER19]|uniref:hypothetical protein n=1 Tax=Nocardioides sp. CER19 TaxID=3038538 RepID=UPI0024475CF9|nr:hypothetical protein [Nocardioides sp. CER19]MDH2413984.1 hypothetical protein [Nocardioides sp. CER19]
MSDRPLLPARLAIGLFLLAGLALPLAATVHAGVSGPELHGEVVAVAGPAVVAQAAVDRANAMSDRPVHARVVESPDGLEPDERAARAEVSSGAAAAAVVIDLRRTADTLLVAGWLPSDVARQLASDAAAVSASYGRTLHTVRVSPPRPGSPHLPARLVALLVGVGIALAAALSAWRGPVAATTARGAARLSGTAAAGCAVGAVVAALVDTGRPLVTALVCAAAVSVSAWLVLAAESLLGLAGLGLATGLLLGPVVPLLSGTDPAYLPSPWWQVDRLAPQQATLRLLQHDLMGIDVAAARSWLLLLAWAAIAVLTLVASRQERPATRTP